MGKALEKLSGLFWSSILSFGLVRSSKELKSFGGSCSISFSCFCRRNLVNVPKDLKCLHILLTYNKTSYGHKFLWFVLIKDKKIICQQPELSTSNVLSRHFGCPYKAIFGLHFSSLLVGNVKNQNKSDQPHSSLPTR